MIITFNILIINSYNIVLKYFLSENICLLSIQFYFYGVGIPGYSDGIFIASIYFTQAGYSIDYNIHQSHNRKNIWLKNYILINTNQTIIPS